jgi:hypothetical protein
MYSLYDQIGTRSGACGSEGKEMQHGRAVGSREGDARSGMKGVVGPGTVGLGARGEERGLGGTWSTRWEGREWTGLRRGKGGLMRSDEGLSERR